MLNKGDLNSTFSDNGMIKTSLNNRVNNIKKPCYYHLKRKKSLFQKGSTLKKLPHVTGNSSSYQITVQEI